MQMSMKHYGWMLFIAMVASALVTPARAQDDQAAELAKKLANPVASLISVPVQYNYDEYGGANEGAAVSTLNIQPVIPFALNENWNLITRTIVPLIDRQDFPLEAMNESGLGDIVASQFFSPKSPTAGGWIGAGRIAANGYRRSARRRTVGSRADGGGAEAVGTMDGRLSDQPYLVRGR
jgi:hypothetical protein